MKKKLAITLLSLLSIICVCFGVSADAATPSVTYKTDISVVPGSFEGYSDISGDIKTGTIKDTAITTVDYKAKDGCDVHIELTPYSSVEDMDDDKTGDELTKAQAAQTELKEAYNQVKNANEVTDFAPVVKGYGQNFGIEDTCMIVSNLFDVTTYVDEGGSHSDTYDHTRLYNIKMTTDSLQYFMCLLHYNGTNWEIVKGAKVTGEDKDTLTFEWKDGSPFAIITCGAKGNCQLGYKGNKDAGTDGYDKRRIGNTGYGRYILGNSETGIDVTYILIGLLIISMIFNVYFVLKSRENRR